MKGTIVQAFRTGISWVDSCSPLCTTWFCERSELWCEIEDVELQEVHSGSPGPVPWVEQVPNTQWWSTPVGQCQGNALTRFSPHLFFLMFCYNALWFPAENSLHVTNNPMQKNSAWSQAYCISRQKWAWSGGWCGMVAGPIPFRAGSVWTWVWVLPWKGLSEIFLSFPKLIVLYNALFH